MTQDVCDKPDTTSLKQVETSLESVLCNETKKKKEKQSFGLSTSQYSKREWDSTRHTINDLSLNLKQLRQLNEIQLTKTGTALTVDQVAMLVAVYTRQANTTKALKKLSSVTLSSSKKKSQIKALVTSGLLDQSGMLGEYSLGLVADGVIAAALKPCL